MADLIDCLDDIETNVMSGLKDFQRATVERIDALYRGGCKRILVSDEVGLGKTLVARGAIAKLAQLQKEDHDKLVKVVYICSNAAIAEQNLNKLKLSDEQRADHAAFSRLSMQHLNIFMQERDSELLSRYIQLISLTPDTSFRITAGTGTVQERALMFALLCQLPRLAPYERALDVAMMDYAHSAWIWCREEYERKVCTCNIKTGGKYLKYMLPKINREMRKRRSDGSTYYEELIDHLDSVRGNQYRRVAGSGIIGKLRVMFAQLSLDKLEPDLVIMDEFQRFKYLINSDPESETGMLANKFFNSEQVRMLLLSATPYKMYSTLEEIDESQIDEHYSEFINVMDFLNTSQEERACFKTVWSNYSVMLRELSQGNAAILSAKNAAEAAMYRHICRTERITDMATADMTDDSDKDTPLDVSAQDVLSYMQMESLLEDIDAPFHVPVDYVKSSPYLMSFMRDYQLKRYIERHFKAHPEQVSQMARELFWLKRKTIDKYERIPYANARLDRVAKRVFQSNAELLLWVPPSMPYYPPQGVYQHAQGFSKTLVFSSWEMVPRMLASLLSYESERRTSGKLAKSAPDQDAKYFHGKGKRYPPARLNFSVSGETPGAMTLFCLMYPSPFLAECYAPLDCLNRQLSLKEIEADVRRKITAALAKYSAPKTGAIDHRWYYLTPLLLDEPHYVQAWLDSDRDLAVDDDDEEKNRRQKGFLAHLNALKELFALTEQGRRVDLGRMPSDLVDVLSDMAIASPAVCIYRTYLQYAPKASIPSYLPSQIAKLFINRMNTPESTSAILLSTGKRSEDAHWQNVLTYCKDGNLQSVFDEYAHLLSNGSDAGSQSIASLHRSISESMKVRTTTYTVDTYTAFRARMCGQKERPTAIRTHFAVAFTKGDGQSKDTDRKKTVRNSFNAPFRPFVLASTSIGQEGLDFHHYCRRIVHWNLPSNPIDLEQREGRVNRFKCLAIRQNVASRYGRVAFRENVWTELFEAARQAEKVVGSSDLIPYWELRETPDMVKIERIVPMYPFSRDQSTYDRLIKILSLYRLTLGQARQEELLEYILKQYEDTAELQDLFINLSPFYRGDFPCRDSAGNR